MDGIVCRPHKEVNVSTWKGKKDKTKTWIEQESRMKYDFFVRIKIRQEHTSQAKNWNQPGTKNKNKWGKNNVDYDGDEDGVTREAQSRNYKMSTPNTDNAYNSRYNRCTNVNRNNDNTKNNNNDNNDG